MERAGAVWRARLLAPLTAIQFLTVSPAWVRRAFTPLELGEAVAYFPLVGALLGGLLLGARPLLAAVFPVEVQAALLLTLWLGLTGGLHLDGYLDSLDGLLGGFTPERRLEILKDKSVGAFAFAGGVCLLLLKWSALSAILERGAPGALRGLLLAPILARWTVALAIWTCPYARPQGLGRAMKDATTWRQALLATLLTVGATLAALGPLQGGLALLAALLTLLALARFTLKRIPGLTGDSYGMLAEVCEAVVLLLFAGGLAGL